MTYLTASASTLYPLLTCADLPAALINARHTDTVASVGFSTDGSLAASGCYGGLLRVWETNTGALKHVLEGPEDIECLT